MAVQGLASLKRKLQRLPDLAKQEIAKAMEIGAQEIVALARSLAPVDDGDLRDSIDWTWGEAPKGSITLGSVRAGKSGNLVITVYAGDDWAFYARWVEFGTAPHNVAKGGGTVSGRVAAKGGGGRGHPGARAQPFFYPAYRAVRRKVRGRVSRAINKAAKRAAAGG